MGTTARIFAVITAAMFEVAIVVLNCLLFFGFTFMNNVETPAIGRIALMLMCILDPISFVLSWFKPRIAGQILIVTSVVTLLMSLLASDLHNLQSLWLSGTLFWAAKFFLAAFFWYRSIYQGAGPGAGEAK